MIPMTHLTVTVSLQYNSIHSTIVYLSLYTLAFHIYRYTTLNTLLQRPETSTTPRTTKYDRLK
jgi:hypothetical protein